MALSRWRSVGRRRDRVGRLENVSTGAAIGLIPSRSSRLTRTSTRPMISPSGADPRRHQEPLREPVGQRVVGRGHREHAGGIVFLRKVEPGSADRSYGIEVAKLAGLPPEVIARAREVLKLHERAEERVPIQLRHGDDSKAFAAAQLTIFTPLSQKIVDRLREAEVNQLTPLQALNLLQELKDQLD